MANRFYVDAETDGLYGGFLSVAAMVTDEDGNVLRTFYTSVENPTVTSDWVKENVVPYLGNADKQVSSEEQLLSDFWNFWKENKESCGNEAIAYFNTPVESRLFQSCIERDVKGRQWDGPYPLLDLASVFKARGMNPDQPMSELTGMTLIPHDARNDVNMMAAAWEKFADPSYNQEQISNNNEQKTSDLLPLDENGNCVVTLVETSPTCPKQYDIYVGIDEEAVRIGYFRLRNGYLGVDYKGDPCFTQDFSEVISKTWGGTNEADAGYDSVAYQKEWLTALLSEAQHRGDLPSDFSGRITVNKIKDTDVRYYHDEESDEFYIEKFNIKGKPDLNISNTEFRQIQSHQDTIRNNSGNVTVTPEYGEKYLTQKSQQQNLSMRDVNVIGSKKDVKHKPRHL